jgi:hypothetical protein
LAGDGFTKAELLVGEGNAVLWSLLGAGNLEADGLAIEENFGIPEDFKGVAEVEGSIVADYAQGVYGQPEKRKRPMMEMVRRTKGSKSIVLGFIPSRHFVWHQNPWIMGVGVPNVVDAPPTGPCSEKGCFIGWRVDRHVGASSRIHKDCEDRFHISCSFCIAQHSN